MNSTPIIMESPQQKSYEFPYYFRFSPTHSWCLRRQVKKESINWCLLYTLHYDLFHSFSFFIVSVCFSSKNIHVAFFYVCVCFSSMFYSQFSIASIHYQQIPSSIHAFNVRVFVNLWVLFSIFDLFISRLMSFVWKSSIVFSLFFFLLLCFSLSYLMEQ